MLRLFALLWIAAALGCADEAVPLIPTDSLIRSPTAAQAPWLPWVLGHRGIASTHPDNPLPENSIVSALRALAVGADGLEIDLIKTRDGVLVLSHDDDLERCLDAGTTRSDCTGQISQSRWDDLSRCRMLSPDPAFPSGSLDTLDDLLALGDMELLLLDVKDDVEKQPESLDPLGAIDAIAASLYAADEPEHVILGLYNDSAREYAAALGLRTCLKYHGHLDWSLDVLLKKVDLVDGWGVCVNYPVLSDELVAEVHARGQEVLAYVNGHRQTPDELEAMLVDMRRWGVRAFLTDEVELVLALAAGREEERPQRAFAPRSAKACTSHDR